MQKRNPLLNVYQELHKTLASPSFTMMLRKKPTGYVFLGRNKLSIVFKKKIVHSETHTQPLNAEQVCHACTSWNCSKIVLFLDPPWLLQTFQITIPLAAEDALQYCQNILGFHHQKAEKFSKIGLAVLELSEKNKKGLFAAALSCQTMQLIERLQAHLRIKVEPFPLLAACIPELLKVSGEVCFFHGLSQTALLHTQDKVLQKMVLLPEPLSKAGNQKIAEDFLHVSLEKTQRLNFEESLALATVKQWRKVQKQVRFEWERPKVSWKGSWKGFALAAWLVGMGGAFYGFFSIQETNQWRQNEIQNAQKQIKKGQVQIEKFRNYTAQREQFLRVNTVYQQLKTSAETAQKTLHLVGSLNDQVWIEQLHYEQEQLHLRLLTLNTALVPQILDELTALPLAEKVVLKSQERMQLAHHAVTKFHLQIQLKANHVEPTQAPAIAPTLQ